MPSREEHLNSNTWTWPKCEWFFASLAWLAALLVACVRRVPGFGRVSASILPIPGSQSPRRRCATWRNWWWGRMCKCTCTSPRCRRFRRWRKNWWKLPRRLWRRMRRCRWPTWEPDQNSLCVRVIKASRLDGFKMALKEKMHFAGRVMYVVTYKLLTGIAIYVIIISYAKILATPIIYKHVGKVSVENTPFGSINVCPSHLFPAKLLIDSKKVYVKAKLKGWAFDAFGEKWSLEQAAKLYYYVYKRCNSALSHSRFFNSSFERESLNLGTFLKTHSNMTLQDDSEDQDFQKILKFVDKHQGNLDCSKMLKACRWGPNSSWNCSEIFEVEETETGQCCRLKRINGQGKWSEHTPETNGPKWNIDEHSYFDAKSSQNKGLNKSPWFQKIAGSEHGITLVIIMETKKMACPINAGNAYMVYIHSTLDAPQAMTNGILIEPNHEVHINVHGDITLSAKEVIDLPLDIRQCRFQKENPLLKYGSYTENNCRSHCRTLLFQERCQCHKLGTTAGKKEIFCGPQHAKCENDLERDIQNKGYSEMCLTLMKPMTCYHGCTEVAYNTVVSSSSYFTTPSLIDGLNLKEGQATAIVRIFFGSDTTDAHERQPQYDFWETIGIIGGFLGLMIGFDFMTLVHLVYSGGIWIKGLRLKWKLANSTIARSIVHVTDIIGAVNTASTQTPTDSRPHNLDFAKRKHFKRVVIKRKGPVVPADPSISLDPAVPAEPELTPRSTTPVAGPSRPKTMADMVMTHGILKNKSFIQKRRVNRVDPSDWIDPVPSTADDQIDPDIADNLIDPATADTDDPINPVNPDPVISTDSFALIDQITPEDVIALINSLASADSLHC